MLNPDILVSSEPDLFIQLVCFLLLGASTPIRQEHERNFLITNRVENTPNHSRWLSNLVLASYQNSVNIRNYTGQCLFGSFLLTLFGLFNDFIEDLLFLAV
jgi:hypothetical protein